MFTTPEILCDLFYFLDKDQIEKIQLVNQFWNNVIIRHNNILPLRQFVRLVLNLNRIRLYVTEADFYTDRVSYQIKFDGTNLSKIEKNVSSWYSQLTVDEVLKNLNDIIFDSFHIEYSGNRLDILLNMMKLVTTKTGGRFRGRYGQWYEGRFGSKLNEIFDKYIIVDELTLDHPYSPDKYIREVCANPEIVQLPSTPKEIRLAHLEFKEDEEVLNFTCNGKLNGANRVTIGFKTSEINYGNFIRQWFELYRTHQSPISLIGKFVAHYDFEIVLDALKTFLNNTQLRVKYSLETKEFHISYYDITNKYVKRSCVLHETDSYALVIEMTYRDVNDMSSINASDLDQLPYNKMESISFCVKSLC